MLINKRLIWIIAFPTVSIVLPLAISTRAFWWPLSNHGLVVDIIEKFHAFPQCLLKGKGICQGNNIVSKNGHGLWYHIPYNIVTVKIGKKNKENMRIHFMLIHWMLYSQFIQMYIKILLCVRIFTLLGTFWDSGCLHARCLARGLRSKYMGEI